MATEFCVCNCDSLSAALELGSGALVLNFANESTPGGRYRSGGRAQEEDLCRLLPQLAPSLEDAARQEPTRQPGSDSCSDSRFPETDRRELSKLPLEPSHRDWHAKFFS